MIKSRRMERAGYVEIRGEEECLHGLGERTGEKRPFGRPERRWEDNIKTDLQERGWEDVWIHVTQNRAKWKVFVNSVTNLRLSQDAGNSLNEDA
jgi:hypothetical protein